MRNVNKGGKVKRGLKAVDKAGGKEGMPEPKRPKARPASSSKNPVERVKRVEKDLRRGRTAPGKPAPTERPARRGRPDVTASPRGTKVPASSAPSPGAASKPARKAEEAKSQYLSMLEQMRQQATVAQRAASSPLRPTRPGQRPPTRGSRPVRRRDTQGYNPGYPTM